MLVRVWVCIRLGLYGFLTPLACPGVYSGKFIRKLAPREKRFPLCPHSGLRVDLRHYPLPMPYDISHMRYVMHPHGLVLIIIIATHVACQWLPGHWANGLHHPWGAPLRIALDDSLGAQA